jgi:hypothetical protein
MAFYCSKCRKKFKNFEDGVCMPCPIGGDHDLYERRTLSAGEKLARDWGFGPKDYAKTMGLDQDPDWDESFDLDDVGEGD